MREGKRKKALQTINMAAFAVTVYTYILDYDGKRKRELNYVRGGSAMEFEK